MLTLFVVPSGKPNADYNRTVASFQNSGIEVTPVLIATWRDINNYQKKHEWCGIFWDNEGLDLQMQKVLKEHLSGKRWDALILFKRIGEEEAEFRIRFVRKTVMLTHDFAPLDQWLKREQILDGWVVEHASLRTD